jgi:diacylglycerol kinase family enzyme
VINGLSSRDDVEAACTIPIGIIPAGSDNSLVWTVLGIRDPIAAALMIVKVKKKTCINHPSYQSQPLQ